MSNKSTCFEVIVFVALLNLFSRAFYRNLVPEAQIITLQDELTRLKKINDQTECTNSFRVLSISLGKSQTSIPTPLNHAFSLAIAFKPFKQIENRNSLPSCVKKW